jgi:hypothetical protein
VVGDGSVVSCTPKQFALAVAEVGALLRGLVGQTLVPQEGIGRVEGLLLLENWGVVVKVVHAQHLSWTQWAEVLGAARLPRVGGGGLLVPWVVPRVPALLAFVPLLS